MSEICSVECSITIIDVQLSILELELYNIELELYYWNYTIGIIGLDYLTSLSTFSLSVFKFWVTIFKYYTQGISLVLTPNVCTWCTFRFYRFYMLKP